MKKVLVCDSDKETTFEDTEEARMKLWDTALNWFEKHELLDGESLSQSDKTYEEAPIILEKLAKCFKFKTKWKV